MNPNSKSKKSKDQQFDLPEWMHNIKIRFYKNRFPRQNDIVMAHIKSVDDDVGFYMELDEYCNMDALIVFREICRSFKQHDIMNTFVSNTIYPLTVSERSYRRLKNTNQTNQTDTETPTEIQPGIPESILNQTNDDPNETNKTNESNDLNESNDIDDDSSIEENEQELNSEDETIENIDASEVNIDLSNRQLSDEEKTQAKFVYNRYKQIHAIIHNFAFALRKSMLKSQDEALNINVDNYRSFLTDIAMRTMWKYTPDKIVDIMQLVRDNNNLIDDYFEFNSEEKQLFIQNLAKGLNKTKYDLQCLIHLQTISTSGVQIIKTALENIDKAGLQVFVVSPPNYMIKGTANTIDKLQDTIKKVISDTSDYMQSNFGLASVPECKITNNINDDIIKIDL